MKLSLNSNFHHTKKHCANNALHWDYFMTFRKSHWWTLFYEILRGGLFCFSPTSSEQWTLAARKKGQTVARYAYLHHHHHHHHHHHQSSAVRSQVWEKSLMQLLSNGEVHMTHLWTPLFNMFWRVNLWWLFGIVGIRDPHPKSIFWPKTVIF